MFAIRIGWRVYDRISRWLRQRQTGDGCEKQETIIQKSGESQESRKSGGTRKWKVENYRFPM